MMSVQHSSTKALYAAVLLLAFFQCAFAHTYLSSVFLNNVALQEGDCVRPHPQKLYENPIPLVTAPDMRCGWLPYSANPANRKCPVAAGSSFGIQWHHNNAYPSDDILDPTHVGPVMVYLAKSDSGEGNVWFKIFEDGFSGGRWGTDRMLDNHGRTDVTIPADLAPGNYLLRGEILALHNAYFTNGVQPYVGCVEITITGSGSATPAGVAFPGAYSNADPGMNVNIYGPPITSYLIPGPALYKSGSSSSTVVTLPTPAPSTPAPPVTPTGGNLKVQVNSGSNVWWFTVSITGGYEPTKQVEISDAGAVSTWTTMNVLDYGFMFSRSIMLTLPISLRLTSGSGKQVVLDKFITSWTNFNVLDTSMDYNTASAPTNYPTYPPTNAPSDPTYAPTSAPTNAPTQGPSSSSVSFTLHSGTSSWWLAVAVNGVDSSKISKVEIMDSGALTSYALVSTSDWGYYVYNTNGAQLVAPVTIRVTSVSGSSVTGTFATITPGAQATASGQL